VTPARAAQAATASVPGHWSIDPSADGIVVRLSGSWRMQDHLSPPAAVETQLASAPSARHLSFTLEQVQARVEKIIDRFGAVKVDELITDGSTSTQGTLRTVDRALDGDSRIGYEGLRALRGVADTAQSLKALADYLERHPDALLRGKGGPESK
jgi:paraquat-inducible protein B